MSTQQIVTAGGQKFNVEVDCTPDKCPICNHHVDPTFLISSAAHPATRRRLEFVFRCTRATCQSLFIAYYIGTNNGAQLNNPERYRLERTAPAVAAPAVVGQEVSAISPTFVTVYNQALSAEAAGLDQLTGIGLRKALEFLVKDFAISLSPDKREAIERTQLGQCIAAYLDDPNLKQCAARAVWLGNDETHYVRKWEGKDISDLKILVRLTLNWAENVILTKRYVSEMS